MARAALVFLFLLLAAAFAGAAPAQVVSCPDATGGSGGNPLFVNYYLTADGCTTTNPGSGVLLRAHVDDEYPRVVFADPNTDIASASTTSVSGTCSAGSPPSGNSYIFGYGSGAVCDVFVTLVDGTTFQLRATHAGIWAESYTNVAFNFGGTLPTPAITNLTPNQGPEAGGNDVVITGTDFTGATAVTFGGTPATSFVVDSNTQITAVAPAGTGTAPVVVAIGSSESNAVTYTYVLPTPAITNLAPNQGPEVGGNDVVITGVDFTGATAVTFGANPATSFVVDSNTQITAVAPPGTGTAQVVVAVGSSESNAVAYTYIVPTPAITNLAPNQGPEAGGTSVTITGVDFTGATAVTFGGTAATSFVVDSNTQITAVAPAGTGTAQVVVAVGSSESNAVTYTYVLPTPAITSLSPDEGPEVGGNDVVITGTDFTGATAVTFGANPATSFVVDSNTQVTAVAPAGTGTAQVVVNVGSSESNAVLYTYLVPPPAPVITSLSPDEGPEAGGTPVVITGTGFTGATAVTFGANPATSFVVDSDTQITATSPAGTGTVPVTVATPGGTSAGVDFTYLATGPVIPQDSLNIREIQTLVSPLVARNSGRAIGDAVAGGVALGLGGPGGIEIDSDGAFMAFTATSAAAGQRAIAGLVDKPVIEPYAEWSLWLDGRVTGLSADSIGLSGQQVNLTGGLGFRLNPDVLIGVVGGYETFDYDVSALSGSLSGQGGSIGSYLGWRIGDNFIFDAALVWSGLRYDAVSGAASGSFDADRILATAGFAGSLDLAPFVLEPSGRLRGLWESQESWVDSLGTTHPARDFSTGTLSLGTKIALPFEAGSGTAVTPYLGLYGDYGFSADSAGGGTFLTDGWSGRLTSGIGIGTPGGLSYTLDGEVGGLGSDLLDWSVRGRIGGSF